MNIISLEIPEIKVICPEKHGDARGFFSESYKKSALASAGIDHEFVQDNHSFSAEAGTLRGLHFQIPPFAQGKLIRVIRGAVLDVAVDIRVGSPTFGKHVSAVISAENWKQILLPVGFAHGLLTLEPNTEVLYKMTGDYSKESDRGVFWNDPEIGIDWGIDAGPAVLSDSDMALPLLADLPKYFDYEASSLE